MNDIISSNGTKKSVCTRLHLRIPFRHPSKTYHTNQLIALMHKYVITLSSVPPPHPKPELIRKIWLHREIKFINFHICLLHLFIYYFFNFIFICLMIIKFFSFHIIIILFSSFKPPWPHSTAISSLFIILLHILIFFTVPRRPLPFLYFVSLSAPSSATLVLSSSRPLILSFSLSLS